MNRIRELRKCQNLSALYVSTELGLSRNMIGAYERGEREPSLEVLKKISQFFNVSTDYLLEISDEKWTNKKAHSAGTENA